MKKIIIILAVLLTAFLANVNSAYSQNNCPNGYTKYFDTLTIDGCDYEIELCVSCSPSAPIVNFWVFSFAKIGSCSTSFLPNEVFDDISDQVNTLSYISELLDSCDSEPIPCEEFERASYTYYQHICWTKVILNGKLVYVPCLSSGDVYCFTTWEWCLNGFGWNRTLTYGPDISGDIEDCELLPSEVPDPTLPGIYSDCFRFETNCSPY